MGMMKSVGTALHIILYRSFIQKSKHWKHPNIGIILRGFLNLFILNKRFSRHMLFKLVYFLPCVTFHITYCTLCAKMSSFDHCTLLELKFLNSGNTVNL
jgi:hypothetical protein